MTASRGDEIDLEACLNAGIKTATGIPRPEWASKGYACDVMNPDEIAVDGDPGNVQGQPQTGPTGPTAPTPYVIPLGHVIV